MFITKNTKKVGNKEYNYEIVAESYRDPKKKRPKKRMVINLAKLPASLATSIKNIVSNKWINMQTKKIVIEKTVDYWFYKAILATIRDLKIDKVFEKVYPENHKLVLLMIIGKIITRWSKLSIVNWIKRNEPIAEELWFSQTELKKLNEKNLYSAQYDLNNLQDKIEKKWNIYNKDKIDTIFLYDITSLYFEWKENELAAYWYNRDKKKWKKIITVWLITNKQWFPLKIKVFKWNVLDFKTVEEQIDDLQILKNELKNLKEEFNSSNIVLVWDRWMRIKYNLENMEDNNKEWVKYITGLTTDEIRNLEDDWIIQMSLFDKDLVEASEWGKRYILCVNPELAKKKMKQEKGLN